MFFFTRIWHSKADSAPQVTLHLWEANAESGKLVPMSVKVGEKAWQTKFFLSFSAMTSHSWSVVSNILCPDPYKQQFQ